MAAVQILAVLFHIHSIALSRATVHRQTQVHICTWSSGWEEIKKRKNNSEVSEIMIMLLNIIREHIINRDKATEVLFEASTLAFFTGCVTELGTLSSAKYALSVLFDECENSHPAHLLLPPSHEASGRLLYSGRKEGNSPLLLGETGLSPRVTDAHSLMLWSKHSRRYSTQVTCGKHVQFSYHAFVPRRAALPFLPLDP